MRRVQESLIACQIGFLSSRFAAGGNYLYAFIHFPNLRDRAVSEPRAIVHGGGRQYETNEASQIKIKAPQIRPASARFGALQKCRRGFPPCREFSEVLRPCNRRIHRLVLFRTTTVFQSYSCSTLPNLPRAKEPRGIDDQRSPCRRPAVGLRSSG